MIFEELKRLLSGCKGTLYLGEFSDKKKGLGVYEDGGVWYAYEMQIKGAEPIMFCEGDEEEVCAAFADRALTDYPTLTEVFYDSLPKTECLRNVKYNEGVEYECVLFNDEKQTEYFLKAVGLMARTLSQKPVLYLKSSDGKNSTVCEVIGLQTDRTDDFVTTLIRTSEGEIVPIMGAYLRDMQRKDFTVFSDINVE